MTGSGKPVPGSEVDADEPGAVDHQDLPWAAATFIDVSSLQSAGIAHVAAPPWPEPHER